jgi:putative transposase
MPQSLSEILVHIVFSTKDREASIPGEVHAPLHAFLAGVCRNAGCEGLRVGGVADHVHLAVRISRTITVAALIEELKTASSKWIKTQCTGMKGFHWQRGYGAFSIGYSQLPALLRYVDSQPQRHRRITFQEEYRALLQRYGIAFDERYVWD